jgi:hypothetical protein
MSFFDEKVILGLQPMSNKFSQSSIQTCIKFPKNQENKWQNGLKLVWLEVYDRKN